MEPATSLVKAAEKAVEEGKTEFLYGNVIFKVAHDMPLGVASTFFQLEVRGKKYMVYSEKDSIKRRLNETT